MKNVFIIFFGSIYLLYVVRSTVVPYLFIKASSSLSMTTEQTPSTVKSHNMWLKALAEIY